MECFTSLNPPITFTAILWEHDTHRIKPHILLVEDNTSQVQLYCAYLKPQFSVSIAANGRQALTFLKNEKVDLIISRYSNARSEAELNYDNNWKKSKHLQRLLSFCLIH